MVWSATYDSFGKTTIGTETITNNLRFPGQYYDTETGLHYNWNRYYDPETGRYMRVDPFGEGLNLYLYVQNNPIKYIDPWGLTAVKPERSFWGNVGQFGLGVVDSVVDTGRGIKALATTNPVDTAKNIYNAASHPVQTFNTIKDGYVEKSKSARGIGSIVGDVAQFALGGEIVKSATKLTSSLVKAGSKGQTFQRVMSNAELTATMETGLLRGGRSGKNFFTNDASLNAKRAQQRLGLDGPLRDVRVEFQIKNNVQVSGPRRASPGQTGTSGGGREFSTSGHTEIDILRVNSLR